MINAAQNVRLWKRENLLGIVQLLVDFSNVVLKQIIIFVMPASTVALFQVGFNLNVNKLCSNGKIQFIFTFMVIVTKQWKL